RRRGRQGTRRARDRGRARDVGDVAPRRRLRPEGPQRAPVREPEGHHGRQEEDDRGQGPGRPRPRRGRPRPEDEGHGPRAAPRPALGQDDRGRRGHPGQGAAPAPPRGSEGHLVPTILTFAEAREGKLRRPTLEAISEGRRIADSLGSSRVMAVLIGSGVSGLVDELASYGADKVWVFDDAALKDYATESYARALAKAIEDEKPSVVLVPFTATGKDLAPRVAAKVNAGLVSDVVGLAVKDGRLTARKPQYSGKAYATVTWHGEPQMATLRPNVFPLGAPDASRKADVMKGTVHPSSRARVTAVHAAAGAKVELGEAQIIVSGGRGLKGP